MKPPLFLPAYSRVKQLAAKLRLKPSAVLKDLTQRRYVCVCVCVCATCICVSLASFCPCVSPANTCQHLTLSSSPHHARHGKLYAYCPQGPALSPHWLQFRSPKEVLVPYPLAAQYAAHTHALSVSASISSDGGETGTGAGQREVLEQDKAAVVAASMTFLQRQRQRTRSSSGSGSGERERETRVLALLGHFNHGKTSLLDTLTGSAHVQNEATGITQTIRSQRMLLPHAAPGGALPRVGESASASASASVREREREGDLAVTLVDTPGQDIFYRMRNYGAAVADAVLLVVSAAPGTCVCACVNVYTYVSLALTLAPYLTTPTPTPTHTPTTSLPPSLPP